MKFADLTTRTITAAVLIGSLIVLEKLHELQLSFLGLPLASLFPITAFILIVICGIEFIWLCESTQKNNRLFFGYGIVTIGPSVLMLVLYFLRPVDSLSALGGRVLGTGVLSLFFGLALVASAGKRSLEEATRRVTETLLGSVLVGIGGAAIVCLSLLQSHSLLFWVVAVVAGNDTGAYFIGKWLGNKKLSVAISPGKSVEGALGGLCVGAVIGLGISMLWSTWFFHGSFFNPAILFYALIVGVFGQISDLTKSVMKRIANVKDSSALLPGHGGFLDRLDGILGGSVAILIIAVLFES